MRELKGKVSKKGFVSKTKRNFIVEGEIMKKLTLSLALVCLLVVPAMAVKPDVAVTGEPNQPEVNVADPYIVIDWEVGTATTAIKWSVDIEGTVIFNDGDDVDTDGDGDPNDPEVMDFEVSFGTSDRTDGGGMIETDLTITFEQLFDAIEEALGVDVDIILVTDATAKVKGLNPTKKKRSNSAFSEPSAPFSVP